MGKKEEAFYAKIFSLQKRHEIIREKLQRLRGCNNEIASMLQVKKGGAFAFEVHHTLYIMRVPKQYVVNGILKWLKNEQKILLKEYLDAVNEMLEEEKNFENKFYAEKEGLKT